MKYTGIALLFMGIVCIFFGIIFYMAADDPSMEHKFLVSPTFPFVMSVISIGAGVVILRFGGRGYTDGSDVDPDAKKE